MLLGVGAQDVKQRALKIVWGTTGVHGVKPTEEELVSALSPFGEILHVGIKEKCAAVLFASGDSVAAAAGRSWAKWDVQPMTRAASKENSPTPSRATRSRKPHVVEYHLACPAERSVDERGLGAEGRGEASRPWTADYEMMDRGVSAAKQNEDDASVEPTWGRSDINVDVNLTHHVYSSQTKPGVCNGDSREGRGGVCSRSRERRVAHKVEWRTESPKRHFSPAKLDQPAPQLSNSLMSSYFDEGGGTSTRRTQHNASDRRDVETSEPCSPLDGGTVLRHSGEHHMLGQELSPLSSPEELKNSACMLSKEDNFDEALNKDPKEIPGGGSTCRDGPTQRAAESDNHGLAEDRRKYGDINADGVPFLEGGVSRELRGNHDFPVSREQWNQENSLPGVSIPLVAALLPSTTAANDKAHCYDDNQGILDRQRLLANREEQESFHRQGKTATSDHTKARNQAKRLALEVARLRSALRATASNLKAERTARVRLEDEWWRKTREWENDRGGLVEAKQEAERISRAAEKEALEVRKQEEAHKAETASDHATQEVAQRKAESAMKEVMKVQDRLVQALQTEVDMTNRVREATQDEACGTKAQLHLYVGDFLRWRDRAKRLEARIIELGFPKPLFEDEKDTLHSTNFPSTPVSPALRHLKKSQRRKRDEGLAVGSSTVENDLHLDITSQDKDTGESGDSRETNPVSDIGKYSLKTDPSGEREEGHPNFTCKARRESGPEGGGSIDDTDLSAPERCARFFETTGYTPHILIGDELNDPSVPEAVSSTMAFSAGVTTGVTSSTSRAYFQRSMKAQQEISYRLERDLAKARAELQSIFAGRAEKHSWGTHVGLLTKKEGGVGCLDKSRLAGATLFSATPNQQDFCRVKGSSKGNPLLPSGDVNGLGEVVLQPQNSVVGSASCGFDTPGEGTGPRMARVLAVLLDAGPVDGGKMRPMRNKLQPAHDETEKAGTGRRSSTTTPAPSPLNLSDFHPMLQVVFSGEPAVLPTPTDLGFDYRVCKASERVGVTCRRGGLREQSRSQRHPPQAFGIASNLNDTRSRNITPRLTTEILAKTTPGHNQASTANASPVMASSSYGKDGETALSGEKAGSKGAFDIRNKEECALAGAFRKFEAKSPLLQRWLSERFSPPRASVA